MESDKEKLVHPHCPAVYSQSCCIFIQQNLRRGWLHDVVSYLLQYDEGQQSRHHTKSEGTNRQPREVNTSPDFGHRAVAPDNF